jgi:hypothetical protein
MKFQEPMIGLIERIARALERLGPIEPQTPDFADADAFVFQAGTEGFLAVGEVNRVPPELLKSIDRNRDTLLTNTGRLGVKL